MEQGVDQHILVVFGVWVTRALYWTAPIIQWLDVLTLKM